MLVLAGRPEGRRELLEALARTLGVDDRVRFVGDVEDVAGLLGASDIGVLGSPADGGEGCPNAVIETMAAGLPFVGTDIPGIRETVGEMGWPLLVPPGDPDALGSALALVCAKPGLRARIGAHNASRQRLLFSPERMLDDTVAAIHAGLAASA